MLQLKPSTKDLLVDVVHKTEVLKEHLDKNAAEHDFVSGITTEIAVFSIGFFINKMSVLLIGKVIISNPILLLAAVSAGVIAMYYPKMRAYSQRHALYRKYGVVSDHIDHILEIVTELRKEENESN